jgi:hypothetical protein
MRSATLSSSRQTRHAATAPSPCRLIAAAAAAPSAMAPGDGLSANSSLSSAALCAFESGWRVRRRHYHAADASLETTGRGTFLVAVGRYCAACNGLLH